MQKWLTDHMVERIQSNGCVNYRYNPPLYKGNVVHADNHKVAKIPS